MHGDDGHLYHGRRFITLRDSGAPACPLTQDRLLQYVRDIR